MKPDNATAGSEGSAIGARTTELLKEQWQNIIRHTDHLCSWLMVCQWLFAVSVAFWISPRTWSGVNSGVHPHVWLAVVLGGIITAFPVYLAWVQPGKVFTRHVIATGQMLMSAVLIHITGGRIETHFHVFGSLAILSFYRDWRVLMTATTVVATDHLIRGIFWPQSVYGVLSAPLWRTFEHAGWVIFEVTFLIIAIRKSHTEMLLVAERQAKLEALNESIEKTVAERTAQLTRENRNRLESQALYHSLVEQLPAGVFRKDIAGRYVFVNSWFCKLRGKKPEEILGKTPAELAPLEPDENHARLLRRGVSHHQEIVRTGKSIEDVETHADAVGMTRHLQVIKTPVFGADGGVAGTQGIQFDITERKRAEAELAYEQYLLNSLLDNSDEQIYFKDADSRFIRCSNSVARLFGVDDPAKLIGKSDRDFFSAEHTQEALEDERTIIQTGRSLIGKMEKETWPDGRITWALTSKMPLRDKNGRISGTFGVSKNITELKEAEAKLKQIHKQLIDASRQAGMAEVATSVLHNVGNVLNSVNVSSSLIADKVRSSKISNLSKVVALIRAHENNLGDFFTNHPKGRQVIGYIAELGTHLVEEQQEILREAASLVNNIVHIKEIVTMQQSYARISGLVESVKVVDLVEDAVHMNNGSLDRHEVKVVRDFAEVGPVLVEKHKVLQILVNLIRNAKHACDDSGRADKEIILRVANGNNRIKISVTDNGIGILPENLTRIFSHGFTTRKGGHGFGLHSGALAAKELGGSLSAFSEGSGRGATFTLELPTTTPKEDL